MARVSGSIGIRQDLEVREGHALTPQIAPIAITGPGTFDPTGGQLVLKLLSQKLDDTELLPNAFDAPERLADDAAGRVRFRITQSTAKVEAVRVAAGPEPTIGSVARPRRRLWWTCSWQDSLGELYPLYYGTYDIVLGAAEGSP